MMVRWQVELWRCLVIAGVCSALACAGPETQQSGEELALGEPRVRIGAAEGDSAYLLYGAWQAQRRGDGSIVVINGGTNQIRIYDASGRHVRTFGGRGDAPGEFRMLQQIGAIRGDTIAAYDIGLGRISIFSPGGDFVRAVSVRPFGNNVLPRALGFTGEGRMLVRTDFDRVFRAGERRDTVAFALLGIDGTPGDTLGRYAGEESFVITGEGASMRRNIAFGRDVYASARDDRIIIGSSDALRFDVFDASGARLRTHTEEQAERRVSADDVRAADELWIARIPSQFRSNLEKRVGEFPHRDTYPAFEHLIIGEDGSIWVQEFATPGRPARRWTVYGPDGNVRRRVRASEALYIVDAGADYVLARLRDELDVESILLFDLPAAR